MTKAIDILKGMKLQEFREIHPDFPEHAIPQPKFSDRTSNGLTKFGAEP